MQALSQIFTPGHRILCLALTCSTLIFTAPSFSDTSATPKHYLGTASCSSSNCHGSSSPRNSTSVLQNEYVTWSKHDRHAKAWLVLTSPEAQKIADNLGISAVEKEPWCLRCHGTFTQQPEVSSKFKVEDGVSCETCHGAAESYIGSHAAKDSSHSKNIENGMRELVPLDKRASFCLSCHYGSENASVNHRLMGAGHPRLSFELDTFSMLQPLHWKVDDDYVKRKSNYQNAQAWLIGQLELASATLEALSSESRSKYGPFPELTLLTCYSCHHSLQREQWKSREYEGHPGELRLNTAALFMVQHALSTLGLPEATEISSGLQKLESSFREFSTKSAAQVLLQPISNARRTILQAPLDAGAIRKLLKGLVKISAEVPHLQYEFAEQLAMGMSALTASLSLDRPLYKSEISAVYQALRQPHEFNADEFTKACAQFLRAL